MRIFIHIGDARTGTTSLQAMMTENRNRLLELGVDYPAVGLPGSGTGTGQHLLAFSLLPEWPKFALRAKVTAENVWGQLDEYIEASFDKKNSLFISSEAFSSLDSKGIAYVRERFRDHDVIPIFVRRDPTDWARSMREQRIKKGHVAPPLWPKMKRDLGQEKIDRWSELFDVQCVPYGQDCLGEVLLVAGVEISDLVQVERRNQQPPKGAIELLNNLNAIPMADEHRARFNEAILKWATAEAESTKTRPRRKKHSKGRKKKSRKTLFQIFRNRFRQKLHGFWERVPFFRRS